LALAQPFDGSSLVDAAIVHRLNQAQRPAAQPRAARSMFTQPRSSRRSSAAAAC
jgi:hypothetical protein